jgi:hypothetical protein
LWQCRAGRGGRARHGGTGRQGIIACHGRAWRPGRACCHGRARHDVGQGKVARQGMMLEQSRTGHGGRAEHDG